MFSSGGTRNTVGMVQFIGSWFIAYLLGGGLILAVMLYFVFFRKHSLMSQIFLLVKRLNADGRLTAATLQTN